MSNKKWKVCAEKTIILDPRTDNILKCYCNEWPGEGVFLVEEVDKENENKNFLVGRSVVEPKFTRSILVRILNPTMAKIKIFKNEVVAHMELIDDPQRIQMVNIGERGNQSLTGEERLRKLSGTKVYAVQEGLENSRLSNQVDLTNSVLSKNGQYKLRELIDQYSAAFGDLGCYNGPIQHRIDLVPGTAPIASRAYRAPMKLKEEIRKQVEDMLNKGVIEPSTSPFAAPVVMVPKKDTSLRFAIDYRRLNAATIKSVYHLPLITDILDEVSGKKIFSSFDFASGYHQIPVYQKHRERTAFTTFLGLFQFTRMPFGLSGAPLTFQRIMNNMKKYLSATFLIYLDDVILASDSEITHLEDIEQFLRVVIRFGMNLKIKKCQFGLAQIKYLGFLIDENGIKIDKKDVEVIDKMQKPETLTELRSFLGACSYFRRFIGKFAQIVSPLYDLTAEGKFLKPEQWAMDQNTAFAEIKSRLKSAPVLASPRLGSPFIMETDASLRGIAATLLQTAKDSKAEHPIAFASQTLKKHQRNYHINELEALAVVFGLKQFRAYVEGSGKITVRSDNSVICAKYFKVKPPLTGRMAKFILEIQAFDVQFEHKKGKNNKFCDYVSRYVNAVADGMAPANVGKENSDEGKEDVIVTREQICVEQEKEFEKIIKMLKSESQQATNSEKSELAHLSWQNGLLCWNNNEDVDDYKIVLPYSLREKMIKIFHENQFIGGHLGAARTSEKMKRRFYWPKMEKDITNYTKSCPICQVIKNPTRPINQPLSISEKGSRPFEHIRLDIMGPLELSSSKNQYVLAVVDSFSKFIVAEADQRSKSSHYCKCISRPRIYKKWLPKNYSDGSRSAIRE